MKSQLKKLPKSQVELTFTVDADTLTQARESAYRRLSPQVKVPGFRPGKAPRTMIEQYLNPTTLMQQALDEALNQSYQEVIKEHEILPVGQPQVNLDQVEWGKPLQVKAIVPVRPEVKLGNYKKIKVKKETPAVDEQQVDEMLQTIFERSQQQKKKSEVSQRAQAGALVDKDGQPMTATQQEPVKADAEMDDAWAKSLGANDLAELRAQVRTDLEAQEKYQSEQKWQEAVIDEFIGQTKAELPDVFISDELRRMRDQFNQQLASVGISLEQYLSQSGKTDQDLDDQWRPQAEKQAMLEAAMVELASQENLKVDDEEVDAELAKVDDKTRAQFADADKRFYLNYTLWRQKVLRKLFEYAEDK
jgi:trigger factor